MDSRGARWGWFDGVKGRPYSEPADEEEAKWYRAAYRVGKHARRKTG